MSIGVRARGTALLAAAGVIVLAAVGCSGGVPEGPVKPGVTTGRLGGIEAVGYLAHPDSSQEEWALYAAALSPSSSVSPQLVARMRPGSHDFQKLNEVEGRYVWVAGRQAESNGEVPVILVDALETVQAP